MPVGAIHERFIADRNGKMIDIEKLKEFDARRDTDEIKTRIVARIQPHLANEWPAQLAPSVRDAPIQSGIPCPYQHQADAISKAIEGTDKDRPPE